MKFRKKPVVVDAWQWLFAEGGERPPSWMNDALAKWPEVGGAIFEPDYPGGARILIVTPEGPHIASAGDWIIRGVKGEICPVKDEMFRETYESVEA